MSTKYPGGFITKSPVAPTATAASGVWTLDQQQQAQKAGTWPSPPLFIEDMFSTWLYEGNSSTQTINNGVNVSGRGGLVWIKDRSATWSHALFDTVRGTTSLLRSDSSASEINEGNFSSFNSNGFSLSGAGTQVGINISGNNYVSWTFREQPKFFSIASWTGDGVAGRVIPHNLGSAPGCILVKRVSGGFGEDWQVYHRSLSASQNLVLNTTAAAATQTPNAFGTVTSTGFQLPNAGAGNSSGYPYIAYLFAHDAGGFPASGTGSENGISCGSFTTDSNGNATVNLGYEPQWVLIKSSSNVNNWAIVDNMRGWVANGGYAELNPNTTAAENNLLVEAFLPLTATGFNAQFTSGNANRTYIYIAIRRGPMKTPTTGTSVFYPNAIPQADTINSTNVPFPPDLVNTFSRNGTNRSFAYNQFQFADRLRSLGVPSDTFTGSGCPALISSSTDVEGNTASYIQLRADSQNIIRSNGWNDPQYGSWIYYFMRRAPGFFDEVCYTGTGTPTTFAHNLGVVPELMIVKRRNGTSIWAVYASPLASAPTKYLQLNEPDGELTVSVLWNNTAPTSSVFTIGASTNINTVGSTNVAYLFASCPGVSKVGSYTGTGATQVINCGFTGGARFVLIKATSTTGNWLVWDSARGIVAGNDPYLALNSTAAEVTNTDWVDTAASGFELSNAGGNLANSNGVSYIFLAIA